MYMRIFVFLCMGNAAQAGASIRPGNGVPRTTVAFAVAMVLMALQTCVEAYPDIFLYKHALSSCQGVPTKGYGSHGRPIKDRPSVVFEVMRKGKLWPNLNAGLKYNVTVTFPSPRRALVVASSGVLTFPQEPKPGYRRCPNRLLIGPRDGSSAGQKVIRFILAVPRQGASKVVLTVVSATGPTGNYLRAKATLPVKGSVDNKAIAAGTAAAAAAVAAADTLQVVQLMPTRSQNLDG